MADRKNKPKDAGVKAFLDAVPDPKRKADCQALVRLMRAITRAEPVLWGASVVGFGTYTYTFPSGRTADRFTLGFSPRKKDISVFVTPSLSGFGDLLTRLGPHKCGKACLYVTALGDVDSKVLKELLTRAAAKSNGTGG